MGGGGGLVTAAVGRIETLDIASSLDLSIDDLRASVTVLLPGVALDDRTLDSSDAWRKCDVAVMIVPNDSSCACGLDVGVVMAEQSRNEEWLCELAGQLSIEFSCRAVWRMCPSAVWVAARRSTSRGIRRAVGPAVSRVRYTGGVPFLAERQRWSHERIPPVMMLLPSCGAAVTVMLGCLGLLFPKAVGRVIGIEPESPLGITEFRATYGGFFLCLGIGCLIAQSAQVFAVVGAAWCTAAFARLLSYPVDGGRTRHNLAGVGVEAGIGLAMLSAQF